RRGGDLQLVAARTDLDGGRLDAGVGGVDAGHHGGERAITEVGGDRGAPALGDLDRRRSRHDGRRRGERAGGHVRLCRRCTLDIEGDGAGQRGGRGGGDHLVGARRGLAGVPGRLLRQRLGGGLEGRELGVDALVGGDDRLGVGLLV